MIPKSSPHDWRNILLGDITREVSERVGKNNEVPRIYGVEREAGLTPTPKYVAKDVSRYKKIDPGMFAYNPMRLNIGSLGFCSLDHQPGAVSPDYVVFQCDRSLVDPQYMYYLTQSPQWGEWVHGAGVGSVRVRIYYRELARMQLWVPPMDEQHSITSVLGALDGKIEQNRRRSSALEQLTRATFKAWFVDFEPVKAKAAGQTSFPGMPQDAFAALPSRFADSPLGQVPEGWQVGKLGDYCEINKRTVRTGQIDGEIEYIDIASVTVGRLYGVQRVPFADAPNRARRCVRHGDTIWSCVRPNRRSYLFVHSPPDNRIASTGFAVLSPAIFGASYLHELTTRQEFVDYLVANADGSAYPAVRPDHFASADVLVPAAIIRKKFEEVTMPLRDLLAASEAESVQLAVLRDYLLPRLLSGQVRVSKAGQRAREAL